MQIKTAIRTSTKMFMVQLSLYSLQFGLHNKFPSLHCMQQYLCIEKRMKNDVIGNCLREVELIGLNQKEQWLVAFIRAWSGEGR